MSSPSAKSAAGAVKQGGSAGFSINEGSQPAWDAARSDRCARTAGCMLVSVASSNFHAPNAQPSEPLRS